VAKPVVDGLERDLAGQARVVRLNVTTGVGRELAGQWGVRGLPTLFVFDQHGEPILRQVGRIDRQGVLNALQD